MEVLCIRLGSVERPSLADHQTLTRATCGMRVRLGCRSLLAANRGKVNDLADDSAAPEAGLEAPKRPAAAKVLARARSVWIDHESGSDDDVTGAVQGHPSGPERGCGGQVDSLLKYLGTVIIVIRKVDAVVTRELENEDLRPRENSDSGCPLRGGHRRQGDHEVLARNPSRCQRPLVYRMPDHESRNEGGKFRRVHGRQSNTTRGKATSRPATPIVLARNAACP